MASAKSRSYSMGFFCGATGDVYRSKPSDEQQIPDTFSATPLDVLRKSATSVCFQVALNGSVWALKCCNNCNNVAFYLEDTAI